MQMEGIKQGKSDGLPDQALTPKLVRDEGTPPKLQAGNPNQVDGS